MRASKKKTMLSKLTALCLAMILTLSMSVTAFAAITPNSTQDVTVSGLDADTTVSIYKVIDVQVNANGQPEDPMYTWTSGMAAWLANNANPTYRTYINTENNAVTTAFTETTAETFRSFWHDVEAAIKDPDGGITMNTAAVDQTVANDQTSVIFSDMPMGEYLLSAKGGVKIYQPTTVLVIPGYDEEENDWTLGGAVVGTDSVMKGEAPDIEKEGTTEDGDKSVAVGDVVDYTLTADVPSYPEDAPYKTFIIGDTLGRGLTFNDDVTVYAGSVSEDNVISDQYYDYTDDGKETFTVTFNTDFFNQASVPQQVIVTYSATVNDDAFEEDALGNGAFLGYNNDPYTDGEYTPSETDEEVYTYGINVTKIAKEDPQKTLAGAQFELSQDSTKLTFDETSQGSGIYKYNPDGTNTTLTVNSNGVLQLQGLDEGTYTLTEIKAPDGYVLPTGTVTVVITDNVISATQAAGEDGVIDAENVTTSGTISVPNGDDDIQINGNVISFKIENTSAEDAGFNLPKTGGMGTMLFTIGGIVLMGGAVAIIVGMTRKKRA